MNDEQFSFRWGIPWLDAGFVQVPDFFFDTYADLGVLPSEFAFILHLARYKYESPRGQSRPSLVTIAKQMGYTVRGVQKLRARLEDKGLLIVTEVRGRPSVYDFQNFALACMRKAGTPELSSTPEPQFTPTPEPQFTPPLNSSSPEEQKQQHEEQQQQAVVVPSSFGPEDAVKSLRELEIRTHSAAKLVARHGVGRVWEVLEGLHRGKGKIRDPAGWVVAALEGGFKVAAEGDGSPGKPNMRLDVSRCAFVRSAALGKCPTEDNKLYLAPWCRACDRGKGVKVG